MKAVKTGFTIYGKYSNEVEYEYRGYKYMVEYATGMNYLGASPKVQHESKQREIDQMIVDRRKPYDPDNTADKAFDAFFRYLETGEWSVN